MSRETSEWLNQNVLIGFTDKHGRAWHYNEDAQGDEPNHYPDAIPYPDVERRLFDFTVCERELFVARADGTREHARPVENRKAMVTSDTGDVLGIFKSGYQGHDYRQWLVENVATLLDSEIGTGIGSAGLLRGRGVAFVSVEVPENITTPEGVEFRPNLIAATSYDGSLATTYKRTITNVVCDNTLAAGLDEEGQQVKIKHTAKSIGRLTDAREALAIIYSAADDFAAEVSSLCALHVAQSEWTRLLDVTAPVTVDMTDRSRTFATNKRNELTALYTSDPRCAPWHGTAYGVLQTYNTYGAHVATTRDRQQGNGGGRIERNMLAGITGRQQQSDAEVMADLGRILGCDLAAI